MPGVIVIPDHLPLGQAIDEIGYIDQVAFAEDLANHVRFVPVR